MLVDSFSKYVDEIQGIKLTMQALKESLPAKINQDAQKYKYAMILDYYLSSKIDGTVDRKLESYMQKFVEIKSVDTENRTIIYTLKKAKEFKGQVLNIEQSKKMVEKYQETIDTMYDNLLISIMIKFENIISDIFRNIISKYTEVYLNNKNVKYTDILKSNSIEEMKEILIDEEVEIIMRQNIFDWIKILKDKHGVSIDINNLYFKEFIEAYYRRNILVHNNGIINNDYIIGLKKVGLEVRDSYKGRKVRIDTDYILKVIDASIYTVFNFVYNIMKLFEDENEDFAGEILNYGMDLIISKKYKLAKEMFYKLKDNKKVTEEIRIYSKINYWQTFKWDNNFDKVKNDVEKFDASANNETIQLAIYSLLDEYEKSFEIINKRFENNNKDYELAGMLEEWPIFQGLRKQTEYNNLKEKYSEVFYDKATIQDENETSKKVIKEDKGKFEMQINFTIE